MTTLSRDAAGVFAIAPTPFLEDGQVDYASLSRLAEFYEASGVSGLTLLGQMGEAPKLSHSESTSIVRHMLGSTSLPVVVGVTAPGFAAMAQLSNEVMDLGAAGVMVAPPHTLRTDDQIASYYSAAGRAVGPTTPMVVQDYPLTFSVVMTPAVLARIAREVENVVMLKHEDWPGLEKISTLRAFEEAGEMPRLAILTGNGGLFLDFEIERGADGAMTGYCFPELLVDVVNSAQRGDRDAAHDLFDAHLPLIRYEQQAGIGLAVRKYIMRRRGLLASEFQRAPRAVMSTRERSEVDLLLIRLATHDPRAAGVAD